MAINSNSVLEDKNPVRSLSSSKTSNLSSCRLIKINFAGKDSCSSSRAHGPNVNRDLKSPYFTNDKVQVLSRVTSKKVMNKNPTEFISSFPLTASVYKANSDEFKFKKRGNHKVKKSVLTLPNEPAPMPKTYTVSDLNDSEYFNAVNDSRVNKSKKRRPVKRVKKSRLKEPTIEIRDRDARFCSQLNIDLDCSSSEIVNITGDGENFSKMSYKSNNTLKAENYPHDVWAILRNINNLQFRSPLSSQQSLVPLRKRRPIVRKTNNKIDAHFIETCRTEEFAYISSFEVDSKTHDCCSPSSSFDRVTVIDKQSEQDKIMQQLSRNIFGSDLDFGEKIKSNINNQVRGRNKRRLKNTSIKESQGKKKGENCQVLENYAHNKSPQSERQTNAAEDHDVLLPELASTTYIFKPTENCSDISSIKENYSASNDQTSDFQKGVRSGDAFKCNNTKSLTKSPKVKVTKPRGDPEKQLNGITEVMLNNGKEIVPSLAETPRKPRLALTLPNSNVPKLSRVEIKRRLANQKFPIVILGKDQLTNRGMYVANVDPPQFHGLDNHIWPFMLEWSGEKRTGSIQGSNQKDIIKSKNSKFKNKVNHHGDMTTNVNQLLNQVVSKKVENKKKKNNVVSTINNKMQLATEVTPQVAQRSKPLSDFKNKMFHFLHKNPPSPKHFGKDWNRVSQIDIVLKDKQVGTIESARNYSNMHDTFCLIGDHIKEVPEKPVENKIVPKLCSPVRHQWAKGKWASDFIENIIKKIRSGVYYGVDRKENKLKTSGAEVCTQTEINLSKNAYCQNGNDWDLESDSTLKTDDPLKNIPGFDKSLPTLEIETISTNKIAVKHCVTNVVVHFDIQVLGEAKNITHTKKSMSCIPVDSINNNQEKVFKCNTSIINAMLPAELCSIIPNMMRNILDYEKKLLLQPTTVDNVTSLLTPASEFMEPESPKQMINFSLHGFVFSDEIRPFLNGRFRSVHPDYKNISKALHCPSENINSAAILSPRVNMQILNHYNTPSLNLHIVVKTSNTLIEKPNKESNRTNYCTVLQPYEPKKWSIVPFSGSFNINYFMKQIINRWNLNILNNIKILTLCNTLASHNTNIISRPLLIPQDENRNIVSLPHSANKVGVISLYNACKINTPYNNNTQSAHGSNTDEPKNDPKKDQSRIPFNDNKTVPQKRGQPIKVLKKKRYVKFYSKCKSMSSISNYKTTPLNRVTNLDEFCQVLGSNLFCNVLDGCLEKKIMNAIEEMNNWVTDINPKQALLIVLLTNKKDTPNLIRFRPVLLQGIAVNRITKADELDTEIEVIERENFKLLQYEGISYLPASLKNQDSLLEELCWIAKTTASDYQKTFDESSEKLLKSLLEKRKMLNPSYLRVMARYVGLGLLAPPKL